IKDGKGQLSATGLHLIGSFKITNDTTGTGLAGGYTFEEHTLPPKAPPAARENGLTSLRSGRIQAENADINDLENSYEGAIQHRTSKDLESENPEIAFSDQQPNGTFNGLLGDIPIHGKVTTSGKMTFSGKLTVMSQSLTVKEGKGQLSATGKFILGSFKLG